MSFNFSANLSSNWAKVGPQFGVGDVHFSITTSVERYKAFLNESSVGNTVLFFVYFRSCLLNPSNALVV